MCSTGLLKNLPPYPSIVFKKSGDASTSTGFRQVAQEIVRNELQALKAAYSASKHKTLVDKSEQCMHLNCLETDWLNFAVQLVHDDLVQELENMPMNATQVTC